MKIETFSWGQNWLVYLRLTCLSKISNKVRAYPKIIKTNQNNDITRKSSITSSSSTYLYWIHKE